MPRDSEIFTPAKKDKCLFYNELHIKNFTSEFKLNYDLKLQNYDLNLYDSNYNRQNKINYCILNIVNKIIESFRYLVRIIDL